MNVNEPLDKGAFEQISLNCEWNDKSKKCIFAEMFSNVVVVDNINYDEWKNNKVIIKA